MNPVELATPPHRSPRVYVSELAVALRPMWLPLALQCTKGVPLSLVVHWTSISLKGSAQIWAEYSQYLPERHKRCKTLALGLVHLLTRVLLCGQCTFWSAEHPQAQAHWRFLIGQLHIVCFI